MNTRQKTILAASVPLMLAATVLATAAPANAWSATSDPTVRVGQSCPTSYRKGLINMYYYSLTRDTATRCYYVHMTEVGAVATSFAKK